MKALTPQLDKKGREPIYIQLYSYLKREIENGGITTGERLPSLRALAETEGISVTTCRSAYDQLLVEGYVDSKPNSGYFVIASGYERSQMTDRATGGTGNGGRKSSSSSSKTSGPRAGNSRDKAPASERRKAAFRDPAAFDFVKWKKCFVRVLNERPEELLSPADPQGEYSLRWEISKYLYIARGVTVSPDRIVVAAGVQQLTGHLTRILKTMGLTIMNAEDPGYDRVKRIFESGGFKLNEIPVGEDGIDAGMLPANIGSAVYVSPSNQFPTGAVMPVSGRQKLLDWAEKNGSVIIEDDYDSELRYFGRPIPPIKSLDRTDSVVYLGSFSSTLFPAARISYMALPAEMAAIFDTIKNYYDQTCSKEEQLTLAEFMRTGNYRAGIRKLRRLCSVKLDKLAEAFGTASPKKASKASSNAASKAPLKGTPEDSSAKPLITPVKVDSGLQLHLRVETALTASELCERAAGVGLRAVPVSHDTARPVVALYFDQIPLDRINEAVKRLRRAWSKK